MFQQLKEVVSTKPVLKLPNFRLPFELHTNTSNRRAIGGVLVQDKHPIAIES